MAEVLEAKTPTETHTIARNRYSTETPEYVVPTKRSGLSQFLEVDVVASESGILSFISGNNEYSIAITPSAVQGFVISSPQDQADAIFEVPGADLFTRLQHVLPALPPAAPGEKLVPTEIVKWLLSFDGPFPAQRFPSITSTQAARRYDRFRTKLVAELLDEPIEDGVTHPGELVIDEALLADSLVCKDWLSQILVDNRKCRPSIAASIVRCIGRLEYDRVGDWGIRVADDALGHDDVEVREAAVRALEAWEGQEALDILRRHEDVESWLDEYVQQVIVDLSETTP